MNFDVSILWMPETYLFAIPLVSKLFQLIQNRRKELRDRRQAEEAQIKQKIQERKIAMQKSANENREYRIPIALACFALKKRLKNIIDRGFFMNFKAEKRIQRSSSELKGLEPSKEVAEFIAHANEDYAKHSTM